LSHRHFFFTNLFFRLKPKLRLGLGFFFMERTTFNNR
jgi:hypothetical protein